MNSRDRFGLSPVATTKEISSNFNQFLPQNCIINPLREDSCDNVPHRYYLRDKNTVLATFHIINFARTLIFNGSKKATTRYIKCKEYSSQR